MADGPPTLLVVGATGILRPAVLELAGRGVTVTAVARSAQRLADLSASTTGVEALAVDHTDVAALHQALAGRPPFDAALVYAPAAPEQSLAVLRAAVDGPAVLLVTSAAAQPPAGDGADGSLDLVAVPMPTGWIHLLLGWQADGTWHSPAQVSAAALDVLAGRRDQVLGAVRPWSDRPQ